MNKYIIHYFYGGQGNYSNHDDAIVEASNKEEAKQKYIDYQKGWSQYWVDDDDAWDETIYTVFEENDRPKGLAKGSSRGDGKYNPVEI
jgi:hypothetical protein